MLRFAPSPTGDISIDDLKVAIVNYITSKQKNEDLLVRIEDTDKEKNIEAKDQEILDILGLFGIEHSQVLYQSQNVRFHTAMALQLIHEKQAFSCFCSDDWIEKKRQEAKEQNVAYKYDDACENLPHELVIDNTNPFTVRIKKPKKAITVKDYVKGDLNFEVGEVDSFIIMNQDKTPSYDFACAIDDMLSDISLIIRNEKYIDSTPKQEHVRASLGYDKKVEYAHLPSIKNSEAISIKGLLEDGYLPSAISNYLISMIMDTPKDIFEIKDALEWFDFDKVLKETDTFDMDKLKAINNKHLKNLDSKELSRYVGFADNEIGELAKIYLDDVGTTKELKAKIKPIFEKKDIPKELEEQASTLMSVIKDAPYFEEYDDFKKYIEDKSALKGTELEESLRFMLTGTKSGPDIAKIYKYLKNYIKEIVK